MTSRQNISALVDNLAVRFPGRRLCIIGGSTYEILTIQVPEVFVSLEIATARSDWLHLSADSTYCSIPLHKYAARSSHQKRELILRNHIATELPDCSYVEGNSSPPPFNFSTDQDVETAAKHIRNVMENGSLLEIDPRSSEVLPWLAAVAGVATSLTTAACMCAKVEVGARGCYITYAGLKAGVASTWATGSVTAATVGVSLGTGFTLAAVVYFVPWAKLARWAVNEWDHFMIFLKSVWNVLRKAFKKLVTIIRKIFTLLRTLKSLVQFAHFLVSSRRPMEW